MNDPDPERHIAWVRQTWEAMQPFSTGVYVNFMSDEPADRLRAVYGPTSTNGSSRPKRATTRRTCSGTIRTSCRNAPIRVAGGVNIDFTR